ncbi:pyridoxamine 5'-phosphate oxidase family protein [Saccharopolyspora phatthalungensis]|uniref:General stress protein 26 n=1 Tax=Saccharopolyspora phatthalungensis TaxID=664693 RepID=A0A840QA91_9PSEU|nr:pyridoxamine 5'-phosphate oxidase family protein [Saccharopolyspora phatthalungensis]MBB5156867.1 general stress protein 26 [Saccharopolyspora phatthalungensis]
MLAIDPYMADVLNEVRVVEFSTITKGGDLNTRPMSSVWSSETGQIMLTVPIAYPQKAYNVRRDGRVALFYSDFTGSGLAGNQTVLVQGTASAPTRIAAPQDIPEFWREVHRRYPDATDWYGSEAFRNTMDWYLWRLRIIVTPERVHLADAVDAGGAWEPCLPGASTMPTRIVDALERYPTAVLCSRDERGFPFATRATVMQDGAGPLQVQPLQPFCGLPGQANLLWHRHNGCGGEMRTLLVTGNLAQHGREWTFVPERMPGEFGSVRDEKSWFRDASARAHRYLERRGLQPPEIDWTVFAAP